MTANEANIENDNLKSAAYDMLLWNYTMSDSSCNNMIQYQNRDVINL